MTNSATCPSCGRPQVFGILDDECTTAVETMLAAIPELVRQLDVAISKQAKVGGAGKGGLARERAPINFGALAVRDALLVAAAFVGSDIDWVRKHPQAAEMVRDLGQAVKDAYRAIDRARDREYLGSCNYEVDQITCYAELWARPKASQVECRECHYLHDVAVRRIDLLELARDQVCTPREASRYVGEIGGIQVGHQRIRNYLDRGRIAERPSHDGVKRLRLGDLLDVLTDDAAKRDVRAS